MYLFWQSAIKPILDAASPSILVEVGAAEGYNTRNLTNYAAQHDCTLHVVDPAPLFDPDEMASLLGEDFVLHRGRSLNALPKIAAPDVVLLDGDHNWYTVYHELKLLEKHAREGGWPFPLVLLHDVDWPYGRRDLYYDPESIPPAYRLPYRQAGLLPDRAEPAGPEGLNSHLNNAIYTHDVRNGVRTAVEDFMSEAPDRLVFQDVPGNHGIGIVAPDAAGKKGATKLRRQLARLGSPEFLVEQARRIEQQRVESLIAAEAEKRRREENEARLEARVAEATAARDEAHRQIEQLRHHLDRAEQESDAVERRLRDLQAELERSAAQLHDAEQSAAALREQLAALEAERADVEAERDGLGGELSAARAESERSAEALEAARRTAAAAEREREALAKTIAATADALRQAERRLAAAELVRDQAQAALERVELERRAAVTARDAAEERAHGLAQALDAESRQAAQAAAALTELRRHLEQQDGQRAVLLETLESQIKRAAGSRSVRYGHRFFRTLAMLTFRRPKQRGTSLDLAAATVLELKSMAREAPPAVPVGVETSATRDERAALQSPQAAGRPAANGAHAPRRRTASPQAEPGFELERELRSTFSDRYEALRLCHGLRGLAERDVSLPLARDGRGMVAGASGARLRPSADVVVCVKDAFDDVRRCLWSVLHHTDRPFRLIIIDDGSLAPTRSMLEELAAREPSIELVRNEGPDHGYTRAANIGLRASTADHVVLLNSDTLVTPGWLDRLIACAESDETIGVVGPLSNAASHQSVPQVREGGAWAVNELPTWLTPTTMAFLVAELSPSARPRFPFVNGFCYAIKRKALDRVGLLDEERFGSGYCEENDLSVRLQEAGYSLAVADDSYVFHAKSRSYTEDGRKAVAGENYKRFLAKHGERRIAMLLEQLDREDGLAAVRRGVAEATSDEQATMKAFRAARPKPLEVLFVLHGMSAGSSGGGHSIYQEVTGMRQLGIPARIAIGAKGLDHARAAYSDADALFAPFRDQSELNAVAAGADVIVATHFTTVALVERLRRLRSDFLAAYYVQDYEPLFLDPASPRMAEAAASYTALPDVLLFAKTHWLCNVVGSVHGVHVAKVEPSVDEQVFNPDGRRPGEGGRLRVTAMIRPRTPRRQPGATLAALRELERARSDRVRITTFGCVDPQLDAVCGGEPPGEHRGILTRAQVADLLRSSDIFLDLSTYQAFGRTALEAMACGCTAVVPAIGGVHEFADASNAVLVDSLRPERAAAELVDLVDDGERVARLQAGAVATAARYSVLKASLAEYTLFEREHRLRVPGRGNGFAVADALLNGAGEKTDTLTNNYSAVRR